MRSASKSRLSIRSEYKRERLGEERRRGVVLECEIWDDE